MSFANKADGLSKKQFDKVRLVFGKEVNDDIRKLMLGMEGAKSINIDPSQKYLLQPLLEQGGIVFEYTPTIQIMTVSSYTAMELTHNNYDFQSYSKSSISELSITGKITAHTLPQADKMLATIHFLRSFTKMNFGENDKKRGTPPRILKLFGYGDYMLNNVPVVIRNYTLTLDETVDYVHTSYNTQVPIFANLHITLNIMPTPSKLKKDFSLNSFIKGSAVKKGYL